MEQLTRERTTKASEPRPPEQPKLRERDEYLQTPEDWPDEGVRIRQKEILEYTNSEWKYTIAKADFERKRASLVLKLATDHKIEKGSRWLARIDEDGRLVVYTTHCDCGSPGPSRSRR